MGRKGCIIGMLKVLLIIVPSFIVGQTKTFNGNISFFWNDPLNWTPIGIPTSADSVILPSGLVNISGGFCAEAVHVHIQSGAELVIERILGSVGKLEILYFNGTAIQNDGILTNRGKIYIEDCLNGISNDGWIHNQMSGEISLHENVMTSLTNRDSVFNNGQITITFQTGISSTAVYNESYIYNDGSFLIDHVGSTAMSITTGNGHFVNKDSLEIRNYNLLDPVQRSGISIIDGMLINEDSGVILIENTLNFSNGITLIRAIMENSGIIKIRDMLGLGISISQDGVLRNENQIEIQDLSLSAMTINETGAYIQRPAGELIIENITGDPLNIEMSTIVEVEGILDVKN